MIRLLDILFSIFGLILLSPIIIMLTIACWFDTRSPFFFQERVGRYGHPFTLIKFRTMHFNTSWLPTHLADPDSITIIGRFLRINKLDEIPQLINVLVGDMSLVGPRPCLTTQYKLIEERKMRNVFDSRPGITGLAQISGIDMSDPDLLARTDEKMLKSLNIWSYFSYLFLTVTGRGNGDRIKS